MSLASNPFVVETKRNKRKRTPAEHRMNWVRKNVRRHTGVKNKEPAPFDMPHRIAAWNNCSTRVWLMPNNDVRQDTPDGEIIGKIRG